MKIHRTEDLARGLQKIEAKMAKQAKIRKKHQKMVDSALNEASKNKAEKLAGVNIAPNSNNSGKPTATKEASK